MWIRNLANVKAVEIYLLNISCLMYAKYYFKHWSDNYFLKNFQEVCGLGKIHIQANIGTLVTNNFRKYAQGGAEQKENIYC